jgi:hypothetical protein
MIGFNGGLIGKDRSISSAQSIPGVWTLDEQLKGRRSGTWSNQNPQFSTASIGSISIITIASASQSLTLSNLNNLLNTPAFQDRTYSAAYAFTLPGASGSSWSFTWLNLDIITYPNLYFRLSRVSAVDSNWQISGTGITTTSGTAISSSASVFAVSLTASSGSATFQTTNASNGLFCVDIALGNVSNVVFVPWV